MIMVTASMSLTLTLTLTLSLTLTLKFTSYAKPQAVNRRLDSKLSFSKITHRSELVTLTGRPDCLIIGMGLSRQRPSIIAVGSHCVAADIP